MNSFLLLLTYLFKTLPNMALSLLIYFKTFFNFELYLITYIFL